MTPETAPEVCPLDAAIDHALRILIQDPGSTERVHAALESAVSLARVQEFASRDELRRRMLRLNALFLNAARFYDGWSVLAGVSECDRSQPSFLLRG